MSLDAAYAAFQAGQLQEAENKLSGHMLRHPTDSVGMQLGAMIAARRGEAQIALSRIRASMSDATNGHEKLNVQGNILGSLGSMIDAQTSFESALSLKPDYHAARSNLANLFLRSASPVEAAEEFRKLISVSPDVAGFHRGLIEGLIESGQMTDAEAALNSAPLSDIEKSAIQSRILFYQGDLDQALSSARHAVSGSDGSAQSLALALQILHMSGRWDQAETTLNAALATHPDRGDMWATALGALHKAGDTQQALELFGRAPRDVNTLTLRADIAIDQGHFADAEEAATQALQLRNGYAPAMFALCLASLGQGKNDQAQQVAELGLKASPQNQFYYAIKATAGRAKGQDYRYFFNYHQFVRPYDLDPPEGWKSIAKFNSDLAKELDRLHGFTAAPLDQTLRLGTQTAPDLRFVDSAPIRAFFEAVDPAIKSYLDHIGRESSHAFTRRNIGGYRIRSAWSVRLGGGGHHVDHIHPEGWISSAYYVNVPKGRDKAGWIRFGRPPDPIADAMGQTAEHEVEPKAGRLVLFPSYLWHGTYPVADKAKGKPRLTLPIDILPDRP